MRNSNETVHYLCFYASKNSNYRIFPSAVPKIEYIISTLKKSHKVVIVSMVQSKKGFMRSSFVKNQDDIGILYFNSFTSKNIFINRLDVLLRFMQLMFYIIFKIKKNDTLLVYHSLFYRRILKIIRFFKKINIIIQVEELYSSVTPNLRHLDFKEVKYLKGFKKIIVVNDLLKEKFSTNLIKPIVCYGDYSDTNFESKKGIDTKSDIILIYAGVIEKVRNAAFFALDIIKLLPNNYKLFIVGFGNDTDIDDLNLAIDSYNRKNNYDKVFYNGYLSGKPYSDMLLSADIGLSCHQYSENDIISADNSFPSKILTYFKHNLVVLSNDITCVKESSIAKEINFFSDNSPQKAAYVIKNIDFSSEKNKINIINQLDKIFSLELDNLIKNNKNDK